jgi:hypothetical protein
MTEDIGCSCRAARGSIGSSCHVNVAIWDTFREHVYCECILQAALGALLFEFGVTSSEGKMAKDWGTEVFLPTRDAGTRDWRMAEHSVG